MTRSSSNWPHLTSITKYCSLLSQSMHAHALSGISVCMLSTLWCKWSSSNTVEMDHAHINHQWLCLLVLRCIVNHSLLHTGRYIHDNPIPCYPPRWTGPGVHSDVNVKPCEVSVLNLLFFMTFLFVIYCTDRLWQNKRDNLLLLHLKKKCAIFDDLSLNLHCMLTQACIHCQVQPTPAPTSVSWHSYILFKTSSYSRIYAWMMF